MSVDYLLVNPNNKILSPYSGSEQPIFASLYATQLRNQGKDVKILDAEVLDLSVKETVEAVRKENPQHLILFMFGNNPSVSSTPKFKVTKEVVDYLIGDLDIKVTGLHTTALPQKSKDELGVEVLRGKIFDGTPDMAYDLFPMDKYIAHNWHCLSGDARQPYAVTYSSLGCVGQCTYCNVSAIYGYQRKVWHRDIDKFLSEIDLLVNKYHVRNIKLWDEHFTVNRKRVIEICDKLIERKYDLNIWAYARVDTVEPIMLYKMCKAGIKWLGVGFESGDDEVLSVVNKRADTLQAKEVVDIIHNAGISVMGNFILFDGQTKESMQKTMDFAKSLNIEFINLYVGENLPGSELFKGQTKSWEQYGQFSPNLPKTEVREFRDKAFNDYFLDPKYLDNIKLKFGQQSVDQVKAMIAYGKPHTR
jgi:radical SAM superfamily enzyme YgiQ (UPF0313 family)